MLINKNFPQVNFWKYLTILILVVFFCVGAWRIINLAVVHDEALSLEIFASKSIPDIFTPEKNAGGNLMANNHLLNTLLMKAGFQLFGYQEAGIRLSAWLALIIYLIAVYLINSLFSNKLLGFSLLLLLLSNPFIFDYLVLARGYGLGLSLMMMSLYLMLTVQNTDNNYYKILLSSMLASVAVLANFVFLYFYLSLFTIWFIKNYLVRNDSRREFYYYLLYFLPSVITLYLFAWPSLHYMSSQGQRFLFFGGSRNFWSDTVQSLISASLYHIQWQSLATKAVSLLVIVVIVSGLLRWLYLLKKDKVSPKSFRFAYLLGFLLLPVIIIYVNFFVTKALFPAERGALWLIPLFYLFMVALVESLLNSKIKSLVLIVLILTVVIQLIYFIISFEPRHTFTWPYCNGLNLTMNNINETTEGPIILTSSWELMPSLYFYLQKFRNNNIGFITVSTGQKPPAKADVYLLLSGDYDVIKKYQLEIKEKLSHDGVMFAIKP